MNRPGIMNVPGLHLPEADQVNSLQQLQLILGTPQPGGGHAVPPPFHRMPPMNQQFRFHPCRLPSLHGLHAPSLGQHVIGAQLSAASVNHSIGLANHLLASHPRYVATQHLHGLPGAAFGLNPISLLSPRTHHARVGDQSSILKLAEAQALSRVAEAEAFARLENQVKLALTLSASTSTSVPFLPNNADHSSLAVSESPAARRETGDLLSNIIDLKHTTPEPFPEKLHRLLMEVESTGSSNVISFTPNGRAFQIHNPGAFAKEIIPQYFKQSKLSSFKRQLNLYGFKLIGSGPFKGGYYHPDFRKGRLDLIETIKRNDIQVQSTSVTMGSSAPDFYSMPPILSYKEAKALAKEKRATTMTHGSERSMHRGQSNEEKR